MHDLSPSSLRAEGEAIQKGKKLDEYLEQCAISYKNFYNEDLIKLDGDSNLKEQLFHAGFIFASHAFFEDEAKFIFGNQKALDLWELSYEDFVGSPSKNTAEIEHQEERENLLKEVKEKGFTNSYSGIRVSSTGKKFEIKDAKVWNVLDKNNKLIGQAVKFSNHVILNERSE